MPRLNRSSPHARERQIARLQRESAFAAPLLRLALASTPSYAWEELVTTDLVHPPARHSLDWYRERLQQAEATRMLRQLATLRARAADPAHPAPTRPELDAQYRSLVAEYAKPTGRRSLLEEDCAALASLVGMWVASADGAAAVGGLLDDIAATCWLTPEMNLRVASLVALAMMREGFGSVRVETTPVQQVASMAAGNLLLGYPLGYRAQPDETPLCWTPAAVAELFIGASSAWHRWLDHGAVPADMHRWLAGAIDCDLINAIWPYIGDRMDEKPV
jgi:hypothetical protein